MNKLEISFETIEVGLKYPVINTYFTEYVLSKEAEEKLSALLDPQECVRTYSFKTGATPYFAYVYFNYGTAPSKIIEIMRSAIAILNDEKYIEEVSECVMKNVL